MTMLDNKWHPFRCTYIELVLTMTDTNPVTSDLLPDTNWLLITQFTKELLEILVRPCEVLISY